MLISRQTEGREKFCFSNARSNKNKNIIFYTVITGIINDLTKVAGNYVSVAGQWKKKHIRLR